jgi:type I restriction enzyme S subunit
MASKWRSEMIGDVVRVASGQVDPKEEKAKSLLVVGSENLYKGGGLDKESLHTAEELGMISGKYAFDAEAILYTKIRPNLNKVCLPDFAGLCSADMYPLWVRDKKSTDRIYVYYLLISERFVYEATSRSFRTGLPKINRTDLESITVEMPPLPEQQNIAGILQTWDAAIELHDALAEQLRNQHTALIHQLVFSGVRLAPYASNQKRKKYRWFNLPSDWQCKRIGTLAHEVSERNREDEAAEILSCSKYDGFVRSLDYFKKQVYSSDLTGYKRIHRGDFGFPSNHVEEGSIGLQNLTDIGLVSPIYTIFRFSTDKIDNEYAHYVLKTGLYRHIFEVNTSASVDRRGSLRWDEFATIPFPVPSLEEQREIVKVLHVSAKRLSALREERSLLERQKRGLMQKLLTGEWRVN